MIKKTLYFGNPAYLSLRQGQLVIKPPEAKGNEHYETKERPPAVTKPIEDIGIIILDNKQITLTQGLMEALLENNCALITCDSRSLPVGLMLPLCGSTIQSERFRQQIESSLPLKKQLWQQTIKCKILNQAYVLEEYSKAEAACMKKWAADVRSGDSDNLEGRAAVYYWKNVFKDMPHCEDFKRARDGFPPNNLLNYGYAILRAIIARAIVSSGMLPTLGIHHRNRYNAYCLADDLMEPYRPYVDVLVLDIIKNEGIDCIDITKQMKARLLTIPTLDVVIGGKRSPLMVAATQTTASLFKCFAGEIRKISYPEM